jgi:hypothetical protein
MSILYPVTAAPLSLTGADQVRSIVDELAVLKGLAVAPKVVGGSGAEAAFTVMVFVDVVEVAWLFDATSRTWYAVALSGAQLEHVFVVYVVVDKYMPGPPPPTMVGLGTSVSSK